MRIYGYVLLTPLVLWALVGPVAAYRAYFQVWEVGIDAPAELHSGALVRADIITSGRTEAMLVLELVQGTRREVLARVRVAKNPWPYWNWRSVSANVSATLEADRLARFTPGGASIRATGYGRPQWMRTPPPVERDLPVRITR